VATELAVQQQVNPLLILQQAVDKGASVEQLTVLMGLAERWEVNQDKKRFREAMTTFSKSQPKIDKNQHVKFTTQKGVTEYDHATLDNVTEQIVAGLSAVGVTHAFRITQQGTISVTCVLSLGVYSEDTTLTAAADESGGKNSIQAVISTTTYLRRHTLLAATGTATGMSDDDGTGIDKLAKENVVDDILAAPTKEDLQTTFSSAYMLAAKRPETQKAFKAAYEQRKAELAKGAAA